MVWLLTAPLCSQEPAASDSTIDSSAAALWQRPSDFTDADSVHAVSLLQPAPLLLPRARVEPADLPSPASEFARSLVGASGTDLSLGQFALRESEQATTISGAEARGRVTSDAGSMLFKSPAAISSGVQRRNPIINDPRIRGSRVGSLVASGSYWIPTRIDLDTPLSKIDSRLIEQMTIIPGPYNVLNGPGFNTLQFDLLPTPRYADGAELHGRTSVDYFQNGQQLYGRQDVWGGSDAGGFRLGYGHRTGNDYQSGGGLDIPSSYNSRDINFALGRDLSPDSHVEFTYLRLDQTNVELPGQAFDIDYLGSDAYEVQYVLENQVAFDRLTADAWYNRSRLNGSAQRPGKRREFPFLDTISFTGRTDVDAMSTGYMLAAAWFAENGEQLIAGTDLRFVNQELNEITSSIGFFPFPGWTNANSPIPDSNWVNPGLFAKYDSALYGSWRTTLGVRTDVASTSIVDDPAKLAAVGTLTPPATFAQVVGTNVQDRTFGLWAAYLSERYERDDGWSLTLSAGHAERAPNLTELYVAQSFMFLLQNGINTVTGDPRLASEKLWQLDAVLAHRGERFNAQVRGFQSWMNDYITFENLSVGSLAGVPRQVNLKYVNTDLATLTGVELLADYRWTDMLTPFANLQYVRGEDQTRNGDFATKDVDTFTPSSFRDYTQVRGAFSGIAGAAKEPLPQIIPLQSRIGLIIHDWEPAWRWSVEISARLVGPQDRVAVSLLEQPTAGFAVGDLRAYWHPSDQWTILGGIENFTDRNYREHLDFRPRQGAAGLGVFQPGINGYVGVQRTY